MEHNSQKFIEKVKRLAEQCRLEVSQVIVGKSVGAIIKVVIDKACVEIAITAKHCTIIDEDGSSESFEKSLNGWEQESLEHIEKLLEPYRLG